MQSSLLKLEHLHKTSEQPFSLIESWVPADRFRRLPDIYAATGHLDRAFEQLGVKGYRRHKAVVSCRTGDPREIKLLELQPGAILIVLKLVYIEDSGEPVCYSIFRYAADRIEFVFYV